MDRREITLVRSARAHLPEIEAYREVLASVYDVKVIEESALKTHGNLDILWLFMGIHRSRYGARVVVHDYRSLSTGKFPRIKDRIKKVTSAKPDLRVFLTPEIELKYGFRDQIPSACIDMGVPSFMLQRTESKVVGDFDFCYVGSISRLRGIPEMLESFIHSPYKKKKLLLVGHAEPEIIERFASENVIFSGVVSQQEVKTFIESSACCICKIPAGYPYDFQTPTKLLEYAALGKKIIANTSPCNQKAALKHEIEVNWCSDLIFDTPFDLDQSSENHSFDPNSVSWDQIIRSSGVMEKLEQVLRND